MTIELGIDHFGDVTQGPDGALKHEGEVLRDLVEQGVLADRVGVDAIGLGEHHRDDYAVSAPEVVLAAIAARTERIRLASAVTVLSSDDPVRVFERFSTLAALSNGRAEVVVGRGSFTESFPLFGYPLEQYEELFEEKLELFRRLLDGGPVTWQGRLRAPLQGQTLFPRLEGDLPTWVGVGGSPESVIRTARHGLPMMLAIIGGDPLRFRPFVDLYHRALTELGTGPGRVGQHSPGHVADTDDEAKEQLWPHYRTYVGRIGAERGWPPPTRESFEEAAGPEGALMVGSPETVANKIVRSARGLGLDRFSLKLSQGPLPHEHTMHAIELYGTRVAPLVREALAADA
ncbi:LLM class flavin-dependent oxidoreductase [Cellulomonas sp. APG4]|uniref:Atu2307/SP_0267 family LLM class monooxygenase n=1 Tax=Cellulomonas sp. APG4 TaxID=1538656 RepID=UPI00137A9B0E|nr:Atu2307/SP_0267 family LLM class monooxygenase [Cellulomonas sp. APG4]NCT90308.1 LLM class flavin-dependent oxidoreductase [Cellulomonas sp. APG4]